MGALSAIGPTLTRARLREYLEIQSKGQVMSKVIVEVTTKYRKSYPWSGAMRMARRGETVPACQQNGPDPEPESTELRQWDQGAGCWVRVPQVVEIKRKPRPAPVPYSDGSGVFWGVFCNVTGVRLWRVEARDGRGAASEARHLCRRSGYDPLGVYFRLEPR